MAQAKKKVSIKQKRATSAQSRTGVRSARQKRHARTGAERDLVPYFLSFCLLLLIGTFAALGYRAIASSKFFDVASVGVNGSNRSSDEEIRNIVTAETERSGVWKADIDVIKQKVEKLPFVRSAAVSRVLPRTINVTVVEKEPAAIVELSSGPALVDDEGKIITALSNPEPSLPVALVGWNEAKTLQAETENAVRLKMYRTMLAEWRQSGLLQKVQSVNIRDVREPIVLSEDSGKRVAIAVGRDRFGENLKNGLMAIAGKGETFEGVALFGTNLRLMPRQTK